MADVKVCGLKDRQSLKSTIEGGAQMVGLNFYSSSPRSVSPEQARPLAQEAQRAGVVPVGLFVDATLQEIAQVLETVPLEGIQLHGAETPQQALEVRRATGLMVIKAVGVSCASDLEACTAFAAAVDYVLLDAHPPVGGLPGGNARSFEWGLVRQARLQMPWILAGGLTPENVTEAIACSGADFVDVSSGVEARRGVKDPAKIQAFLRHAHGV